MSFLATIYENFARIKHGMNDVKFGTKYVAAICTDFDKAYQLFYLAKRMGLSCAICTGETYNKDGVTGNEITVIAYPNEYGQSTSEALREHYSLLKRRQDKENRRFRKLRRKN